MLSGNDLLKNFDKAIERAELWRVSSVPIALTEYLKNFNNLFNLSKNIPANILAREVNVRLAQVCLAIGCLQIETQPSKKPLKAMKYFHFSYNFQMELKGDLHDEKYRQAVTMPLKYIINLYVQEDSANYPREVFNYAADANEKLGEILLAEKNVKEAHLHFLVSYEIRSQPKAVKTCELLLKAYARLKSVMTNNVIFSDITSAACMVFIGYDYTEKEHQKIKDLYNRVTKVKGVSDGVRRNLLQFMQIFLQNIYTVFLDKITGEVRISLAEMINEIVSEVSELIDKTTSVAVGNAEAEKFKENFPSATSNSAYTLTSNDNRAHNNLSEVAGPESEKLEENSSSTASNSTSTNSNARSNPTGQGNTRVRYEKFVARRFTSSPLAKVYTAGDEARVGVRRTS